MIAGWGRNLVVRSSGGEDFFMALFEVVVMSVGNVGCVKESMTEKVNDDESCEGEAQKSLPIQSVSCSTDQDLLQRALSALTS